MSTLCNFEGGPTGDEVDEDVGVLVAEPAEDLWKILLEGIGHTIDEPAAIIDEGAAILHEALESAHGRTFAAQWGQTFKVALEEVDSEESIGGIILGVARGEGAAVPGQDSRVDWEDDEEVVLEQGRHDGSPRKFEADGDGATAEALLELTGPGVDGDGVVLKDDEFGLVFSGWHQADVVLAVSPVETDDGGEVGRLAWHDFSSVYD